jgi:hypothetical protein
MIDFNNTIKTDMRDTGGRYMVLSEISSVPTYVTGGVQIDPESLGLSKIDFISVNTISAVPLVTLDQPWTQVSQISIQRMQFEEEDPVWRILVFVPGENGFEELPDGTPLVMPEQFKPVIFAVGS